LSIDKTGQVLTTTVQGSKKERTFIVSHNRTVIDQWKEAINQYQLAKKLASNTKHKKPTTSLWGIITNRKNRTVTKGKHISQYNGTGQGDVLLLAKHYGYFLIVSTAGQLLTTRNETIANHNGMFPLWEGDKNKICP